MSILPSFCLDFALSSSTRLSSWSWNMRCIWRAFGWNESRSKSKIMVLDGSSVPLQELEKNGKILFWLLFLPALCLIATTLDYLRQVVSLICYARPLTFRIFPDVKMAEITERISFQPAPENDEIIVNMTKSNVCSRIAEIKWTYKPTFRAHMVHLQESVHLWIHHVDRHFLRWSITSFRRHEIAHFSRDKIAELRYEDFLDDRRIGGDNLEVGPEVESEHCIVSGRLANSAIVPERGPVDLLQSGKDERRCLEAFLQLAFATILIAQRYFLTELFDIAWHWRTFSFCPLSSSPFWWHWAGSWGCRWRRMRAARPDRSPLAVADGADAGWT